MPNDHLAKEADRLKNDPVFNNALDDIRSEALNALAMADASSYATMVRLQERVKIVDEIRTTLDRYIMASDVGQESAGSFA